MLWRKDRDPITNFTQLLVEKKISTTEELKLIEREIETEAEEAVNYALDAAWPDSSEVDMHVFASN
jgi:pyruvate dehydrogenase E1 component alpha subunit